MNWSEIITALIISTPPTLMALLAWRESRRNRKESKEDIKEVHVLINSRMTELLDVTGKSKKAEGVLEGRNEIK